MLKLNQFGPKDKPSADIVIDGEIWTIGPENFCGFVCKARLYWEVHFYPERGPEPVARFFVRNAASDE